MKRAVKRVGPALGVILVKEKGCDVCILFCVFEKAILLVRCLCIDVLMK